MFLAVRLGPCHVQVDEIRRNLTLISTGTSYCSISPPQDSGKPVGGTNCN